MLKYLVFIIVLSPIIVSAQTNVLEQLLNNPLYEVTLHQDSTVEIYNKQKDLRYLKTIKQFPEYGKTAEADLIIYLDTINFAAYENLYRDWGSIPAVNYVYGKFISVDANDNNKNEIYAWVFHNNFPNGGHSSLRIFEHSQDSIFSFMYEFPDDTLGAVFDMGDITGDGLLDIFCRGTENKMHFFKQETPNSYINTPNFLYNPFPHVYQPNNATFYDIDGDGNLEIIYFLTAGSLDSVWAGSNHIAKYNSAINNYELVYYHRPQPEWYTNGISTGDFDQDGKGNFGTGSIGGQFYIYEHLADTLYHVEFTTQLETYNAYLTTFTDDMDGNGEPEVWIGGDFSSSIYGGVTRLWAFESLSQGIYEQVYQIDIRGLFSAIDGKMRYTDLDGDGIKELFLTNANLVFGFKFDGMGNYYMDFIIQMPELDSIYISQELWEIDIADLDGDGTVEIIPQYSLSRGWPESLEYRSVFLKRDKTLSAENDGDMIPEEFQLFQNYPNPFNPETKIEFDISEQSNTNIKVYNILGKEIITLLDEEISPGNYRIDWEAKDSNGKLLPSGVYLIRLTADKYSQTVKALLIK